MTEQNNTKVNVTFTCSTPYFYFLTTENIIFFLFIFDFTITSTIPLRNLTTHCRGTSVGNPCIRRRSVVSFTPEPLHRRWRKVGTHWIRWCVAPRTGLVVVAKIKILYCRESRPDRPARSLVRILIEFSRNITFIFTITLLLRLITLHHHQRSYNAE
jgi:hypothetical protein